MWSLGLSGGSLRTLEEVGIDHIDVSRAEGLDWQQTFSKDWACVSYASDVLGVCAMIAQLYYVQRLNAREEYTHLSSSGGLIGGFLGRLTIA